MRSKYVSLVGLLQAAAIVTIVFTIVTAIPIDHFGIQLFAHFKLQYLVVSVLLCVGLALLRQPAYVGGLLLAVGLNASLVVPWYVPDSAPIGDRQLKVLNANVLSSNTEYQRLFDLLDVEAPDIVLLQEVSAQWLVALDPLRQNYPYSYAEAREGNFGIALFSRVPFTSISHVDSPPLGYPTIIATMDLEGTALHLIERALEQLTLALEEHRRLRRRKFTHLVDVGIAAYSAFINVGDIHHRLDGEQMQFT